jgi:hypothetical protein
VTAERHTCPKAEHGTKVLLHLIARTDQVLVPQVQHPHVPTAQVGRNPHVSFPARIITIEPRIGGMLEPARDDVARITQDIDDPY